MLKHTQTIRWKMPTNCSSVFHNFVRLALQGLKGDSSAVFFCEFCEVFENNYFLEHIRSVQPFLIGIWKIPYLQYLRLTLWKCTIFSSIPAFISTDFKFCATSGTYLEPCQKSIMERFCEHSQSVHHRFLIRLYPVSLRILSECGKIRTRITQNTDTFFAVNILYKTLLPLLKGIKIFFKSKSQEKVSFHFL